MRLIGDIGGTNARFALVDVEGNISEVRNYLKTDFATYIDAINVYKKDVEQNIDEVVLAINAPANNGVPFINSNNWGYELDCKKELGIEKIMFFNDLQAHAMSLPFLKDDEKVQIHGTKQDSKGTVAVAGPGTGLGLAYGNYNHQQDKYIFQASEGGNQLAAAVSGEQKDVLDKLNAIMPSVRWEDVSSGRGIISLYKALFDEDKTVEEIMAEFSEDAIKSKEVFKQFCEFLGLFVHNVAITFLPFGGVYIVGGILARQENIEFLKSSTDFLKYYHSSELYDAEYLKDIPIYVVAHFNPALLGLANYKFEL